MSEHPTEPADEYGPLRIIRMSAENVMRIEFVEVDFDPDGGLEVIAGKNRQGKSSLLHAVWLALAGPNAAREIKEPVRDGEETASVYLDLGELRVTREWDTTKRQPTKLTVTRADGRMVSRPQELLDALLGAYSFEPLAFMKANDTTRSQMLLKALGIDVSADEREIDEQFPLRRDAKQVLEALEARLAPLTKPADGVPDVEESAQELFDRHAEARAVAAENNRLRGVAEQAAAEQVRLEAVVEQKRAELAAAETAAAAAAAAATAAGEAASELVDPPMGDLDAQIASVNERNQIIRDANAYRALAADVHKQLGVVGDHELLIAEARGRIRQAIAKAAMPVEGLEYDLETKRVMFEGMPVENAAGVDQLRVSLGIAMALNPHIRIIRVVEGSGVDPDGLRLIDQMAREKGFQVLLESIDVNGQARVVLKDGVVIARDQTAAAGS